MTDDDIKKREELLIMIELWIRAVALDVFNSGDKEVEHIVKNARQELIKFLDKEMAE